MDQPPFKLRHPRAGFTLLELLLVVALLTLFGTAAVLNLAPLWRTAPLEEGVGRLEGLLRFARAEAAQQGRRVRLQLNPSPIPHAYPGPGLGLGAAETPSVQVQWEPEPLRQPGVFVANPSTASIARSVGELVRVESVRRFDSDDPSSPDQAPASAASDFAGSPDDDTIPALEGSLAGPDAWPPINFYPDGSSDSAEILLAVADPSDTRRMLVRWNGVSGTTERLVTRSDGAAPGDAYGLGAGEAQPLEPSSVARSAMGPLQP
jgi:prepilin-type N-terminal cleavage/methylation domain-containing protein